jgi:hypothetical protein
MSVTVDYATTRPLKYVSVFALHPVHLTTGGKIAIKTVGLLGTKISGAVMSHEKQPGPEIFRHAASLEGAGKCALDIPVFKEHYHHIQLHQVDKSAVVGHVTGLGPRIRLAHQGSSTD